MTCEVKLNFVFGPAPATLWVDREKEAFKLIKDKQILSEGVGNSQVPSATKRCLEELDNPALDQTPKKPKRDGDEETCSEGRKLYFFRNVTPSQIPEIGTEQCFGFRADGHTGHSPDTVVLRHVLWRWGDGGVLQLL